MLVMLISDNSQLRRSIEQIGFQIALKTSNQSINKFISRHSTEARATVQLCRIKEKCLEMDLKCVNG